MSTVIATPEPLDIGRVIQDLVTVLRRNLAPFLLLSAILTGIPAVLLGWAHVSFWHEGFYAGWPSRGFTGLISLVSGLVLQGTLIYGTVTDMNGQRATVPQCLSVGLNNFLPLFAIGLLMGIAIACGLILLVAPGVILAVMWSVAIPAFVAERLPVMDSFGRSAQLTEGNRWRILGLFVIFAIAAMLVSALEHALTFGASLTAPGSSWAVRELVVRPIVSVTTSLVGATGAAVLYVELRRLREGVSVEGLASGFKPG